MKPEFNKHEKKLMRAVGAVLRALRKDTECETQEEFSDLIGMNRSQYQTYESGVNMKIISIDKILSHHNISIFVFMEMVRAEFNRNESKQMRKIN
ncbi:MAG: helix-turn-helix transcriptional regulator [Candidatus Paceibacterota bacterium]